MAPWPVAPAGQFHSPASKKRLLFLVSGRVVGSGVKTRFDQKENSLDMVFFPYSKSRTHYQLLPFGVTQFHKPKSQLRSVFFDWTSQTGSEQKRDLIHARVVCDQQCFLPQSLVHGRPPAGRTTGPRRAQGGLWRKLLDLLAPSLGKWSSK